MHDARWNEYDETIKKEVAYYNQKFSGKGDGFVPPDWRWVKAMVWTEVLAGPNESKGQWQQRPMQIGVANDPSLGIVISGQDDANLIVSDDRRNEIRANHFGTNNIKAGIAALYYKGIEGTRSEPRKVGTRPVVDNPQILTYTITNNDRKGIDDVARRMETTRDSIIKNTAGLTEENIAKLSIGQEIRYQKSHYERYITDWRDWMTTIKNYNKNADSTSNSGDSEYIPKVLRAYQIIISRTPQ